MDLTKLLKERCVTKAELSRKMDVTWNTVNNWCLYPNKLTLEKINNINKVLKR